MKIELYNFRKPSRLAVEVELELIRWLERGCVLASEAWSQQVSFPLELAFRQVEASRLADVVAPLPEFMAGYAVSLGPRETNTLMLMPRPAVLAVVAGMLGDPAQEVPSDRELTPVEASLTEYLLQLLLDCLRDSWRIGELVRMQLRHAEVQPKRTRLFSAEQNLTVCQLALTGPFGEQAWHWLIPQESLVEELGRAGVGGSSEQSAGARPRLEMIVRDVPVELSVRLGVADLPVAQLTQLRVGDLVILDQRVAEPLCASVAGETKFRVWPGRVGSRQAFQIESRIEC
jgi:flagellar motor switch protein FliM